jgi:3-oxoacyl-[acyl-carrier-protein] synthase-3
LAQSLPFAHEVGVLGTGSQLGSRVIDNPTLEKLVRGYDPASGDFSQWVERVTHIRSRHFCAEGESAGTMGIAAARRALEASGVDPAEVDLVIVCTFTTRELFPGDAVDIARSINPRCGVFSVAAACAGSLYGLATAFGMVRAGLHRNVMVVGVENLTRAMNFADPLTAILFADGAGAVLVGRRAKPEPGSGFVDRVVLRHDFAPGTIMMDNANVAFADRLTGEAAATTAATPGADVLVRRQFIRMEGGPRVLRNAVNAMADTVVSLLGFTMDHLKRDNPALRELLQQVHLVPHQANGRIVDGLQEKLGIPEEQVYRTIYFAGNMSAATNVVTLDYAMREGNLRRRELPDGRIEITPCGRRLRKGDLVVVTTIGGGYIYGAVGFRL